MKGMQHTHHTPIRKHIGLGILAGLAAMSPGLAQVYNGGGLNAGIQATKTIKLPDADLRTVILNILQTVLSYMALAAVVAIIVAGIYLVLSFGSETARDRAKNIIIYTLVGLVIILFSEVIVNVALHILAGQSFTG
jgi:hypothetical protein